MSTKEALLREVAYAILTEIDGLGRWHKQNERRFKKIDNPLLGLCTGDTVYKYDEENEAMVEDRVLAVVDGVGYVFALYYHDGPTLAQVDDESYSRTREGAIELWRSTIESDIDYLQERVKKLPGLKLLLGGNHEH